MNYVKYRIDCEKAGVLAGGGFVSRTQLVIYGERATSRFFHLPRVIVAVVLAF